MHAAFHTQRGRILYALTESMLLLSRAPTGKQSSELPLPGETEGLLFSRQRVCSPAPGRGWRHCWLCSLGNGKDQSGSFIFRIFTGIA